MRLSEKIAYGVGGIGLMSVLVGFSFVVRLIANLDYVAEHFQWGWTLVHLYVGFGISGIVIMFFAALWLMYDC